MHRLFAKCQDKVVGVTGDSVVLAEGWTVSAVELVKGLRVTVLGRKQLRQSFSLARSPSEVGTVETYIVGFKCYTSYEDLSRD